MKKVVLKGRPVGVPSGQLEIVPPPPPPLPPAPEPKVELEAKDLLPLPAAPTTPVAAAPEPAVEEPQSFEEWMKFAANARPPRGQLAYAQFFATMAQNAALKEIADELGALNDFIGAYDEAEEGEGAAPLRLSDQIAEGLLGAVSALNLEQILANAKGKA